MATKTKCGIPSGIGAGVGPESITKKYLSQIPSKRLSTDDEQYRRSLSSWGVQDQRLAFFFKLCRDLERDALQHHVKRVVAESMKRGQEGQPSEELQGYVDLFVLAFQTRDITEGKGERKLFYFLLLELSKYFPTTVLASLPLIAGKYGSWKDILLILEIIESDLGEVEGAFQKTERQKQLEALQEALMTLMCQTLVSDDKTREKIVRLRGELTAARQAKAKDTVTKLENDLENLKVGLCGKWAPREKSHFSSLAKKLAIRIFQDKTAVVQTDKHKYRCYKQYRQLVARLNKFSRTCEVIMCDARGRWDRLNPAAIPARCLKINRKAFMNQTKKGDKRSDRPDRVKCAEQFTAHLQECVKNPTKAKVHGKNLMPHELVQEYHTSPNHFNPTAVDTDDLTLEAQWVDLRERLKESGSLGNLVPMVDVSGSMEGTPMLVAIALGILVSECCHPAFRNRFLTFDTNPQWHRLSAGASLREKVQSSGAAPWGGSTNFFAALKLILDACVEHRVTVEVVKEMTFCIFSDMQFTDADYGFETKYDQIAQQFKKAGYFDSETGDAVVPRMLFWNLRGNTLDFPARADTLNCDMVSGFSANGLKAFMAGDVLEASPDKPATPYDGMRKQLDDERYDAVRLVCEAAGEIVARSNGAAYRAPVRVEPEEEASDEGAEAAATTFMAQFTTTPPPPPPTKSAAVAAAAPAPPLPPSNTA